ncbi:MAG TPA: alanine--glyoxylate aminotransferase family protein [Candidatus Limnocylindrales bacterium]|nr:alanine--glyoxylate aminotransferase family protein [Candidatus Limnocylindrales bacterium]
MLKKYLLAPGPTAVPHEALLAMAAPMIHHRTPQFSEIFRQAAEGSRKMFGTEQPVLMLSSSGTGAMEAAITNTLSPGDTVLVVNGGKFGERWMEIARTYGLGVVEVPVEWGYAVTQEQVADALKANPGARAVLMQHSETSTTAIHPVEKVAELTRNTDVLLIVDGITSVGVVDCPMDATGIDVLVTGSQKAMMLPPGLALIALSEKAWAASKASKLPRYYFDLAKERKNLADNTTAYTPAVTLILGLKAVYDLIDGEGGWPEVYRRHQVLAEATRRGVEAAGLKLLAPTAPSPATTGVWVPEGVDGGKLTKHLRDTMGVTVAGGQGKLKGKIFRLAHIGYADTFDVIVGLAAVEMALRHFGVDLAFGRGPAAAQEVLLQMYKK